MRPIHRLTLLTSAAIVACMITYFGNCLETVLDPENYTIQTPILWFAIAIILTVPLWVPAVLPARYPTGLKICSWISVMLLLIPSWSFVTSVINVAERMFSEKEVMPLFLIPRLLISFCCFASLIALLFSCLSRRSQST